MFDEAKVGMWYANYGHCFQEDELFAEKLLSIVVDSTCDFAQAVFPRG